MSCDELYLFANRPPDDEAVVVEEEFENNGDFYYIELFLDENNWLLLPLLENKEDFCVALREGLPDDLKRFEEGGWEL